MKLVSNCTAEIIAILESLKKQKCQWRLTQNQSSFYFDGEIKSVGEESFYSEDCLEIKFKGPGKQRLYLRGSFTYEMEDDDKKLRCKVYTEDKNTCLTFGYLKEVPDA
ncbi:hypothetical protein [Bacillus sp. FJAT-52991]|uniref:Uncharacterized protein n=1 Tax=Bacillus kandeliae TaxID=3129297 RepID=A0ABZ2NBH5_9BACI